MTELTELVTQRKLEGEPACPRCGCDYTVTEITTTLVGIVDGIDANHKWESSVCSSCQFAFIVESKRGNTWITKDSKVLAGLPNCFEDYIYTCAHCNGNVVRKYTVEDGCTVATSLLIDKDGPKYRTFYLCQSCAASIEVKS